MAGYEPLDCMLQSDDSCQCRFKRRLAMCDARCCWTEISNRLMPTELPNNYRKSYCFNSFVLFFFYRKRSCKLFYLTFYVSNAVEIDRFAVRLCQFKNLESTSTRSINTIFFVAQCASRHLHADEHIIQVTNYARIQVRGCTCRFASSALWYYDSYT